jgi:hypothetical protein
MCEYQFPYPVNVCGYEPEFLGSKMPYHLNEDETKIIFPKSYLVLLKYYFDAEDIEYEMNVEYVTVKHNVDPHFLTIAKLCEIEKNSSNLDLWITDAVVEAGLTSKTHFISMPQEYIREIRENDREHTKLTAAMMYKLRGFYAYLQDTGYFSEANDKWYFFKLAGMSSKRTKFDPRNMITTDIRKKCPYRSTVYGHLCVSSPEEIIYLLCCSPRLYYSLAMYENTRSLQTSICLREYDPNLENEGLDFRVFIYNSKVTAISQYKWHQFIDALQDAKFCLDVRQRIIDFWNTVLHLFPQYPQIVMDLHLSNDLKDAIIIEFNTFGVHQRCGGGLFNWIHDYDILYNVTGHTELRILSKETHSFIQYD